MIRTLHDSLVILTGMIAVAPAAVLEISGREYRLYPATTAECPSLPSPLVAVDGREFVIVRLRDGSFGLRSLPELEAAFPGRLPEVLRAHDRGGP